ncbi:MAG: hypothetical protein J6K45_04620 [Clostridia bacterium]|nr:hypothetical protein [Clostridia bacterium]
MDLDKDELEATKNNCEFCNKNKVLKSCNFGGSANLRILGDTLDIFANESKFNIFKRIYEPRFVINYCPMCGRKFV